MKLLRNAILICAIGSVVHYFITNKNYTFSVREVKKIAGVYKNQDPSSALSKLSSDFRRMYSKHIISPSETNWFTFGGNLPVKIWLLHTSLTEYLAVMGSPIRASGHVGFHWMNQSCSVLVGNVQRWKDGSQLSSENFRPGDHIRFAMFEGSVVELAENTWVLCYGRGVVPASVPYLALNFLSHSVDPVTPARMLYVSSCSTLREIYQWLQEYYFFYLHKFSG